MEQENKLPKDFFKQFKRKGGLCFFWMSVLTDLKAGSVEDILIACTDNLKGFTDAIRGASPDAVT